MAEYIEREALLKDIEEERPENWTDSEAERQAENDFYKYREIVEIQPTADVVEVVRCKECEHWIYWADEKRCICDLHCTHTIRDDFCSFGKRKEGAEECF